MKELGYVILPNGEIIRFGEYMCSIKRDSDNIKHFHDTAFREVLDKRLEDFPFISDSNSFMLTRDLCLMGQNGYITVLNATQGTFTDGIPSLIMVNPEKLSSEQKSTLIKEEATMNYFDNGLSSINIVNKGGEVVGTYSGIDDFYNDIVDYNYKSTFNIFEAAKNLNK